MIVICVALFTGAAPRTSTAAQPFRIQVVDKETSRGIPQAILLTSLHTRYVTDSNGVVAFEDPLAMGQNLFLVPTSDGYTYDAPGLAMGGVVLQPKAGTSATIVMRREMIAERLYRITGAGIYRDSVALGEKTPIEHPMINANVIGQDSALSTIFDGKLFWIWGDTAQMRHPLATNFASTAAYSDLPTSGGLPADVGINLHYIEHDGFTKHMITKQPDEKSGVFWLSCLMTVPDKNGHNHLLALCNNIAGSSMKTLGRRIVEFDKEKQEFHPVADWSTSASLQPGGHAVTVSKPDGEYIYFVASTAMTRVKKSYEAAIDPSQYEALTCLKTDGDFTTVSAKVNRDKNGKVVYEWRSKTAATGDIQQRELVEAGLLKPDECLVRMVDAETGKPFRPHGSNIAYNKYRKRWTMVASEIGGTSMLGELWYLESDQPEGPWEKAVKVLTHKRYTFYNPLQHPEMVSDDDHFLYFEGTYTKTFSDVQVPTPYYDYNQIMYRVNLDDKRLEVLSDPEEEKLNLKVAE